MLSEIGKGLRLLVYLRPPKMHENGEKDLVERVTSYNARLHRWRVAVAGWLIVCTIGLTTFGVYAEGLMPRIAPGYASRVEVKQLKEQIDRVEVRQLENTLQELRMMQCKALDKRFYTTRLNEVLRDYRALTGEDWRIPQCNELVPPAEQQGEP